MQPSCAISVIITTLQGKLWLRERKRQGRLPGSLGFSLVLISGDDGAPSEPTWVHWLSEVSHLGCYSVPGDPRTYSEPLWAWPLLTRSLHSRYPL